MVPDEVQTATKEYKASMDDLGQFIEDCCLTGSPELQSEPASYTKYTSAGVTRAEHQQIASQKAWGKALTERGYERFTNNGVWYRGITDQKNTQGE